MVSSPEEFAIAGRVRYAIVMLTVEILALVVALGITIVT
jgi:hypothetical protein